MVDLLATPQVKKAFQGELLDILKIREQKVLESLDLFRVVAVLGARGIPHPRSQRGRHLGLVQVGHGEVEAKDEPEEQHRYDREVVGFDQQPLEWGRGKNEPWVIESHGPWN